MDWKKIAPWNWFKDAQSSLPADPRATAAYSDDFPDSSSALRAEMQRLFGGTLLATRSPAASPGWSHRNASLSVCPRVDISEGTKAYMVRADLAGIQLEDIRLEVDGQTLMIRAEKKEDREENGEHYHYVERLRGAVR